MISLDIIFFSMLQNLNYYGSIYSLYFRRSVYKENLSLPIFFFLKKERNIKMGSSLLPYQAILASLLFIGISISFDLTTAQQTGTTRHYNFDVRIARISD